MERGSRRDDRRAAPPREDNRSHRPKYEQDRSRSPPRHDRRDDRRRDRSPHRGGPPPRGVPPPRSDRDNDHVRNRDSARGPPRRPGDRAPPPQEGQTAANGQKGQQSGRGRQATTARPQDIPEDEDSEAEMQRIMGFKDFRTTKNTKVPGNDKNHAIYKVKKAEYRQYMNRTGGFNRPLSPSRS